MSNGTGSRPAVSPEKVTLQNMDCDGVRILFCKPIVKAGNVYSTFVFKAGSRRYVDGAPVGGGHDVFALGTADDLRAN